MKYIYIDGHNSIRIPQATSFYDQIERWVEPQRKFPRKKLVTSEYLYEIFKIKEYKSFKEMVKAWDKKEYKISKEDNDIDESMKSLEYEKIKELEKLIIEIPGGAGVMKRITYQIQNS